MANFWQSRLTFNESKSQYEVNGVMPPDEYQESVDNSIYTNLIANYAISTARWLACMASLDAEAYVPQEWLDKAKKLVFTFNTQKRYHEEFEGFDEQYSNGKLNLVKQADAVLLNYPLLWKMPNDVKRNDLELYEPITDPNGPAMTWSIFAINWMDVGDFDKAELMFNKSYQPYVRQPFNVWTEVQTGTGAVNFITGAGGFLQALIYGYGGLRNYPFCLEVKPVNHFPPGVSKMTFKGLTYLGTKFNMIIEEDSTTFECLSNDSKFVTIKAESGEEIDFLCLDAPKFFSFTKQKLTLQLVYPSACEPPLDEIDVNYEV